MKKSIKFIIVGVVVLILVVLGVILNDTTPSNIDVVSPNADVEVKNVEYVIYIKGEVNRPGLYMIEKDTRINDAIILAGGLTENADISKLNLAQKITDGMSIVIESKQSALHSDRISINQATQKELMTLPHIGSVIANRIIEYRIENNGFKSLEELKNVKGISESIFEEIKEYLYL